MTLDLPPGSPLSDIRRAYARRLKQIDTDADPQDFQALREAYEGALALAEGRARPVAAQGMPASPEPRPDQASELEAFLELVRIHAAPEPNPEQLARSALLSRIASAEDQPNDALRLMGILRDPLLVEPHFAAVVEREILAFLLDRIERGPDQRPLFRLGFAAPPCLRCAPHEARDLMAELNRRFGWFADAVRMQREAGFKELLLAAQDLEPRPQPVQTKVGVKVKALVIGLFILAGVARALLNVMDRPPDPILAARQEMDRLTASQAASAQEIAQDRGWLAEPSQGAPSATTQAILELSLDPNRQPPPDVAAGRKALGRLRAGPPEALSALSWTEAFLGGMLYAHAYVLDHDLGYRVETRFQMTSTEGLARWTNSGPDDRLWPDGPGYVVSMKAPEIGDTVALYPADYIDALRGKAGASVATWQGALLVPPEVLEPGSRLYRIAAPAFPLADELKISNSWSVLTVEAMAQNRWPIRAITLTEVPCAALKWGEAGFEPLAGCP